MPAREGLARAHRAPHYPLQGAVVAPTKFCRKEREVGW